MWVCVCRTVKIGGRMCTNFTSACVCVQECSLFRWTVAARHRRVKKYHERGKRRWRACAVFVCVCVVWVFWGAEHGSWVTPGIQPHLTLINWPGVLPSLHWATWQKGRPQDSAAPPGMICLMAFFFCQSRSVSGSFSVPIIVCLPLSLALCVSVLAVSRWRRHTPVSFAKLAQITQAHPKWLTMVVAVVGRYNAVHCFL